MESNEWVEMVVRCHFSNCENFKQTKMDDLKSTQIWMWRCEKERKSELHINILISMCIFWEMMVSDMDAAWIVSQVHHDDKCEKKNGKPVQK